VRDPRVELVLDKLREGGGRLTRSRRQIVEAIVADAHQHLTAADIVEIIRRRDPDFHESTVYRTLERLTELGVVRPVQLSPGATVFHLVEGTHQHHHLLCDGCGAVIEARDDLLDALARQVSRDYGFALQADAATLHGLCADCHAAVPAHHHDHPHTHRH
jgi:Fur family ferric uptake transcriptional regulator